MHVHRHMLLLRIPEFQQFALKYQHSCISLLHAGFADWGCHIELNRMQILLSMALVAAPWPWLMNH